MFMTLEQLRVFVAVAERQHVTRAAEALNTAQSAVSASIAALEGRHGAKLFNRVGRGIELTEAGALFLVEARAVLARAEFAELVLSELGGLKRGALLSMRARRSLAIGCRDIWSPSVAPIRESPFDCRSAIRLRRRPRCVPAKRILASLRAKLTIRF